MRDLSELSGPWVGFWLQYGLRGSMGLALAFTAGKIHGKGRDSVGGFLMEGSYKADGSVLMTKSYAWHEVLYRGKWDGQMIAGSWKIKREGSGEFEIWPESDRYEVSSMMESSTMELVET